MNDKEQVTINIPLFNADGTPLQTETALEVFKQSSQWSPETHDITIVMDSVEMYTTAYLMTRVSVLTNDGSVSHLKYLASPVPQTDTIIAYLLICGAEIEWAV